MDVSLELSLELSNLQARAAIVGNDPAQLHRDPVPVLTEHADILRLAERLGRKDQGKSRWIGSFVASMAVKTAKVDWRVNKGVNAEMWSRKVEKHARHSLRQGATKYALFILGQALVGSFFNETIPPTPGTLDRLREALSLFKHLRYKGPPMMDLYGYIFALESLVANLCIRGAAPETLAACHVLFDFASSHFAANAHKKVPNPALGDRRDYLDRLTEALSRASLYAYKMEHHAEALKFKEEYATYCEMYGVRYKAPFNPADKVFYSKNPKVVDGNKV